jgi:hypothetical protein
MALAGMKDKIKADAYPSSETNASGFSGTKEGY